jgi:hypothetical protein
VAKENFDDVAERPLITTIMGAETILSGSSPPAKHLSEG